MNQRSRSYADLDAAILHALAWGANTLSLLLLQPDIVELAKPFITRLGDAERIIDRRVHALRKKKKVEPGLDQRGGRYTVSKRMLPEILKPENATHLLSIAQVSCGSRDQHYSPCFVLKEMADDRLKVLVMEESATEDALPVVKIRYVDAERVQECPAEEVAS